MSSGEDSTMIIDVSYHNGVIDWSKVGREIDYAILRCGYGSNDKSQDDKKFYYNATQCEKYGIPYAVYLFSYAKNKRNLVSEVAHILRLIKDRNVVLPIYLDMEKNRIANTGVYPDLARLFVSLIRAEGRKAGLYSSNYLYDKYLKSIDCDSKWIARYSSNPPTTDYDLWQFSSTGTITGIKGRVDCNKLKVNTYSTYAYDQVVNRVLDDEFGIGKERKQALYNLGFNYWRVQYMINVLREM